jgi:hypothetical protein
MGPSGSAVDGEEASESRDAADFPPTSERESRKCRPQVIVRVGDRDLTPQEFTKLVDEMLVVRAALTRVR